MTSYFQNVYMGLFSLFQNGKENSNHTKTVNKIGFGITKCKAYKKPFWTKILYIKSVKVKIGKQAGCKSVESDLSQFLPSLLSPWRGMIHNNSSWGPHASRRRTTVMTCVLVLVLAPVQVGSVISRARHIKRAHGKGCRRGELWADTCLDRRANWGRGRPLNENKCCRHLFFRHFGRVSAAQFELDVSIRVGY